MASIQDIPFRKIPHQSELFLSYLDLSPAALQFYQNEPTLRSLEKRAEELKAWQFPRNDMAAILRRQNQGYGCDDRVLSHIGELENPACVAVVTGQQVGLFGGPLYTLYKALTAVRLAEELKQRGIGAVPVFWMETEDHDLAEVTRRCVIGSGASLQNIDFESILFRHAPIGSVGSIRFPETVRRAIQEYLKGVRDGPGKAEAQFQLESTYKPGSTFAQSFAQLLSRILRGSGLILFDPHEPEAKRLVASVFQKALHRDDAIRTALVGRNQDLQQAGFHTQVNVLDNSTVLFFTENGERRALEKRGSLFGLKNAQQTFHRDELLQYAEQSPEMFSPNVLLRPLIQDHLFPTAAYVAGSAEIAYFAQAEVLYRLFDRPMPIIWPRNSLTLMEPEIEIEMGRLKIEFQDCFLGLSSLTEKAMRHSGLTQAASNLEELGARLNQVLTDVKPDFHSLEAPLAQALETARRKMLHNIHRLKSQLTRIEDNHHSSISSILDSVMNNCYPNQALQERALGIQHFSARHGSSLLDEIRNAIDIGPFAHRLVRL